MCIAERIATRNPPPGPWEHSKKGTWNGDARVLTTLQEMYQVAEYGVEQPVLDWGKNISKIHSVEWEVHTWK
jgi:hypothetical protein